jgi:hypothetical protein
VSSVAIVLFKLVAVPGALAAVHLVLFAIASAFYLASLLRDPGRRINWLVLIPAHTEAEAIGPTLTSSARILATRARCSWSPISSGRLYCRCARR